MRCPALAELPPPPSGKTGWPWTLDTQPLPPTRPDGSAWPRISIVTPSYNQGLFIEETIRSVLLQGYPDLEYFVIDGGSSDQTVEVIRKYERWLTYWTSEKDRGQAHAINKEISRATGEIFNWINSDDLLLPSGLFAIASAVSTADLVAAPIYQFGIGTKEIVAPADLTAENLTSGNPSTKYVQMGCWYKLDQFRATGHLDENMHYAFDLDHMIKHLYHFPSVRYLDVPIGSFRLHPDSKTCAQAQGWPNEMLRMHERLASDPNYARIAANCAVTLEKYKWHITVDRYRTEAGSRLVKFAGLVARCLWNPQVRLTRYTLGAAKQILFRANGH